jgi:hypothetical protein
MPWIYWNQDDGEGISEGNLKDGFRLLFALDYFEFERLMKKLGCWRSRKKS